ncbi:U-box domain-containing protein 4 [Musa acuminata AAA Group]|uniref:U-box domain-containing protein 4 n=1 Tax=Musa acuminata AAA Group TaxID=214697 RepID=UPI0031D3E30F
MASSEIQIPSEDSSDLSGGGRVAVLVQGIMERIRSEDEDDRIQAAREIRRLTKTSAKHRRYLSESIEPLVSMLRYGSPESGEAAMLGLLNLAVRDERNKIKIVDAGALEPLIYFLESTNSCLQEYATASVLTLSATCVNKPKISASGAIPLLVKILKDGNRQARIDAMMALYNLSTIPNNLNTLISLQPIPAVIKLLRSCKKSSRTHEKCCALLELLMGFEEGRAALTFEEGGVLTVVEVLEGGAPSSREHAVGALLTMCESDYSRYRDIILKEGAIPGLLELTIQGTPTSQAKAHQLLDLLRSTSQQRSGIQADAFQNIVSDIVSRIDGDDRAGKAKKMLAEMVQISMEQSLRHLQQRAVLCTPKELPVGGRPSGVHSK